MDQTAPGSNYQPPWMEVNPVGQTPPVSSPQQAAQPDVTTDIQVPPAAPTTTEPPPQVPDPPLTQIPPFKKIIPFVLVAVAILILAFVIRTIVSQKSSNVQSGSKTTGKQITLTYWGLWENQEVIAPLISDYKKQNPNITVNYVFQSAKDYRERLQSSLASGKGPDIFRIHNTWVPMFKSQISQVPEGLVDWTDYYPATDDLKISNKYYAIPLGFDTLALYYNVDLFSQKGVKPPTDWIDLRDTAIALRSPASGPIDIGGIALGTTSNVDNWSDILGLMFMQNGVDLANPTGKFAEETLKFYTMFSQTHHVWDASLPSSVYSFATGKVAMIIAPSWRVFEIKEINPKLNFATAPVPQLPGAKVAWATYWAETVSQTSANQVAAWDFLKFLSQPENLKKLYTYESQTRLFGEPYPKKSMAQNLTGDPLVGAFINQAAYAKSWYLCSRTHDNGINDRMIKYFEDAVNGVIQGKSATEALSQTAAGVSQIITQYQISK